MDIARTIKHLFLWGIAFFIFITFIKAAMPMLLSMSEFLQHWFALLSRALP
jgi:hypothetical protein